MKIRPLPDIDLARIAPLPTDMQRSQLSQLRNGRPPFSYNPLRSSFHDLFNVQPAMFAPVVATPWAVIEDNIRRKARTVEEIDANLAVAKGIYEFALERGVVGRSQEFFPLQMGSGRKVSYWLSMVLAMDDTPFVPFIDPRRSRGLTKEGRRFAFSMMNERIRAADPDYAEVRFAIVQFANGEDGIRTPVIRTDEGLELYSLTELEGMVSATYELWREVCEDRERDTRRRGTGTTGPLI
ncbi:type VI toxin-antitoxin system SocB family DNA replication inhibitor toxin [Rhizobium acaciae]|uniref:type VI toxin-antitoxin system SocB family DNA replication inhibitor toxin n=1 Tax=Rhizobium acaciae TaxID=2989736 RepID=UPI002220AF9B|nr:hypothetical protein [Rhizobium acaciae]MCW1752982.1 hypothetical protein [Rhizobium acaciae]